MSAGYRPDGTPFWGESRWVTTVEALTTISDRPDFATYGSDYIGHRTPAVYDSAGAPVPHVTFHAGEKFRAWITTDSMYLLPGDAVEVRWVVETMPGSAGAVRLVDGVGSATTDRGTLTVSGQQTLTWSATATAADLLGTTPPVAEIEVVSGSVVIQQVKLRVHPPGGAGGSLSAPVADPPVHTRAATTSITYFRANNNNSSPAGDVGAAWDAVWPFVLALPDAPAEGDPQVSDDPGVRFEITPRGSATDYPRIASGYQVEDTTNFDGTEFVADVLTTRGYLYFRTGTIPARDSLPGAEFTDYIVNPFEVFGDPQAYARTPDGSETAVVWDTVYLHSYAVEDSTDMIPSNATIEARTVTEVPSTVMTADTGTVLSTHTYSAFAPTDDTVTLAVPDGSRAFRVLSHHDVEGWSSTPVVHGVNVSTGTGVAKAELRTDVYSTLASGAPRVWFTYTRPNYRYWVPGPPQTAVPLRLMQRGDGLGMGSGRVYGTGTRQASTRVFGSL